jgi:predicted AlkP superfamily phosphohydrolase/phosphomutase
VLPVWLYGSLRMSCLRLLLLCVLSALTQISTAQAVESTAKVDHQLIVLGFDGLDPVLAERWMDEGKLPQFARLRAEGHYQRLPTSNPPQSPVAWASFAVGANPGHHGIYDFLRRDPKTYQPDFSIADVRPAQKYFEALGWKVPLDDAQISNRRRGEPFWLTAQAAKHPATVLRVPVTWPPDPIQHMISGMGVPDLVGSQGTYTLLSTRRVAQAENGGQVLRVRLDADGKVQTRLIGPLHPLASDPKPLEVELRVESVSNDRVRIHLDDTTLELSTGQWSDWVPLSFSFAGLMDVNGMVRLHLSAPLPRLMLYVSPIHIDPRDPVAPISAPGDDAAALAARIGLFHTLGMPEETWSLNSGHLSESAWLDSVKTTLAEGEAMLYDSLTRRDSELLVKVFVQTDRVSHMFWRGLDPSHPLYAQTDATARGAVEWIYRQADRVLGEVRQRMQPGDRLIVLSDHGFASFRRAVHLNRWLLEHGWLVLKPGATRSAELFADVDFSRTRAYAIGLNSLYFNVRGREGKGIVEAADLPQLKAQLIAQLRGVRDPVDAAIMVSEVFDGRALYHGALAPDAPDLVIGYASGYRASWQTSLGGVPSALVEDNDQPWSGDHCMDPAAVPGVLFADHALAQPIANMEAIAAQVRTELGEPALPAPRFDTAATGLSAPVRGVLDWPAPLIAGLDRGLAWALPSWLRLFIYAVLAGVFSMWFYAKVSKQSRLRALRDELKASHRLLASFDGEFRELRQIIGRTMRLSFRQMGLTLGPALLASIPLLLVLPTLSNLFDRSWPDAGAPTTVCVDPVMADVFFSVPVTADADAGPGCSVLPWPSAEQPVRLVDKAGVLALDLPLSIPAAIIHQPWSWSWLLGNPAGDLDARSAVQSLRFELPEQQFLPFGPGWLRGWLAAFLLTMLVSGLVYKFKRGIA